MNEVEAAALDIQQVRAKLCPMLNYTHKNFTTCQDLKNLMAIRLEQVANKG